MQSDFTHIVTEIKDKLDIVDVISKYVVLKKSGANYWGLCPFHGEKTPSFSVNTQKQIYKCFGCGEGGDVFSFLMKINSQSFYEVIKEEAASLNIELPTNFNVEKENKTDKKKDLIKTLKKASDYYNDILLNSSLGKRALEYLEKRNINREIIKTYKLGFSLNEYEFIKNEINLSEDLLEESGLIIKRDNKTGYIDRFRNRIMIPIFNENGDTIAFGARAIEENQNPKYLNSPDTLLYNKSKILYGLYHAKEAIKEENSVIIMEGYFDVIMAQSNEIKNCIASCGTSLTLDHVKLISKYTPSRRIYLSFDLDQAGQKATERNANVIKEAFCGLGEIKRYDESYVDASTINKEKYVCEIRVITPPGGKDPDEFIKEYGAKEYKKYMKESKLLIDYQIDNIINVENGNKTPQMKAKIINKVIPYLVEIKNKIIQSEYIKLVAKKMNISEKSLENELNKYYSDDVIVNKEKKIVTKTSNIEEKAQKILLSAYLMDINTINVNEIKKMINNVNFTNETLKYIKNTIDKISCEVNNVSELIERLYIIYAEDEKVKNTIVDLIYLSDKYKDLSTKDYILVINESIKKIKEIEYKQTLDHLKNSFLQAKDDESAREYQLKIQEYIKKIKLEK